MKVKKQRKSLSRTKRRGAVACSRLHTHSTEWRCQKKNKPLLTKNINNTLYVNIFYDFMITLLKIDSSESQMNAM